MDDLWQLKAACLNRPSSQRFPLSGSLNQSEMSPGQFAHPYVAQEVCVIERTIRQEPAPPNLLNFSSQGFNSKAGRPDFSNSLLALLSGSSQQLRSGFQQSPAPRSSFLASNQQLYPVGSSNPSDMGGWPMTSSVNLSSLGRVGVLEAAGTAVDFSQGSQGRDMTQITRTGAVQDNFEAAMLRSTSLDMFKQALSISNHASDADLQCQPPFPQWLADPGSRRQRLQSIQGMQRLPSLQKNMQPVPDASFGLNSQQSFGTPRSRLRVYCESYSGSPIGGELILTETGRLGVLCLCHNCHMSVAKFSEHAGLITSNPGSAVQMETGETLVQWRKTLFSQFGVKVPEDHVGWEWNDLSSSEVGHAKYKAVMTQSWQKEVDLSYQGEPSVIKSRVTQMWDTSAGSGNSCHTAQGISKAGLIPTNTGQKGSHDFRETTLRNFGRVFRGNTGMDFAPNQPLLQNMHENMARNQETTLNYSSRSNEFGAAPVGEYIDFIKNGIQPYMPAMEQPIAFAGKNMQKGVGPSGWNHGQDAVQPEKDTLTSNFELRLGQPSQQTRSLGPSLSISLESQLSAAAIDRNKSFIYERASQRVWDQNIQQSLQHPTTGAVAMFASSMDQNKEGVHNENWRNHLERNGEVDQTNAEADRGTAASTPSHPVRFFDGNVDNSPMFTVFPRHTEDREHVRSKLVAATASASLIAQASPFPRLSENRALDEQSRVGVSSLDCATPLNQIRNDISMESGNALGAFQSQTSGLHIKQRVGGSDGMETVVGPYLHPHPPLYDKSSLSMKGPAVRAASTLESVAMKSSASQALASSFGTCDSSQTFWIRRGVHGATSEGLSSSSQNQLSEQTNVRLCRAADQGKVQEGRLFGDGSKVQHSTEDAIQNLLASSTGVSDVSNAFGQVNKPCDNQELCQLEGSVEKNDDSQVVHDALAGNALEKNTCSSQVDQGNDNLQLKDGNTRAPEFMTEKGFEDPSNLQTEMNLLHCRDGEQKEPTLVVEDECLEGSKLEEECNCMKSSKVGNPGRAAPGAFSKESGGKELMRNDVVDEGSGIGKCCSSDEVDMGARTNTRPICVGMDAKMWESPTSLGCPSSSDVEIGPKFKNGYKTMKLQGTKAAIVRQDEAALKAVPRTGKLEKRRSKAMKENAESGDKELMRNDVVDEGSGIGKCCSSDEVDMDVRKKVRPISVGVYAKMWESPTSLGCPSSSDVEIGHKVTSGHKTVKLQRSKAAIVRQEEVVLKAAQGAEQGTGKIEKRRRKAMKWKRLDVASPSEETKQVDPRMVEGKSMVDCSFSAEEKLAGRKVSVSNTSVTPAEKTLKRKRTLLTGFNVSKSLHQRQDADDDRCLKDTEKTDHRLQIKGQKLVIKLSPGVSGKQANKGGHLKPEKVSVAVRPVKNQEVKSITEVAKASAGMKLGSGLGKKSSVDVTINNKEKTRHLSNSSASFKNARIPSGRQSSKAARMVSLSSILKLPGTEMGSQSKPGTKSPKALIEAMERVEANPVSTSAVQARQTKDWFSSRMMCNPDNVVQEKAINLPTNVKEVRKRSLWELTAKTKPRHAASQVDSLNEVVKDPVVRDPSSVEPTQMDFEKSNEKACVVPRAERSSRLKHHNKELMREAGGSSMYKSGCRKIPGVHQTGGLNPRSDISETVLETYRVTTKRTNTVASMGRLGMLEPKEESNGIRFPLKFVTKKRDAKEAFANPTVGLSGNGAEEGQPSVRRKKQKFQESLANSQTRFDQIRDPHSQSSAAGWEFIKDKGLKRSCEQLCGEETTKSLQKKRWKKLRPSGLQDSGETVCCVCGSSSSESVNRLIQCNRCYIKVHQACYGVAKIPKSSWVCRPCKAYAKNIVCVLCGYGGAAMTRAKKSRVIVKGLLQAWQEKDDAKGRSKLFNADMNSKMHGNVESSYLVKDAYEPGHSEDNREATTVDVLSLQDPSTGTSLCGSRECDTRVSTKFGNDEIGISHPANHFRMNCTNTSGPVQDRLISHAKGQSIVHNSVTSAVNDPNVTQWVHMVCALWMPGTRCLNVGTMAAFDVSGVTIARRRLVCSICKRPGGACIQCRVTKCSIPFHPWCAHGKGLLQSETVGDEGDKVGFFGRCVLHGKGADEQGEMVQLAEVLPGTSQPKLDESTCARTEGYKGRQTSVVQRAMSRQQLLEPGSMVVSQEQIAAWLRINERKTCTRRFIKPANSDLKTDHREYLRFKQEQGWKRLAVYKSGIHALGLYTAEFITKGEMVVEYIGEIVGLRVADKREADYHSGKRLQHKGECFLFRIDKENIIDATRKGGIARFVNHSCSPNCVAKVICVKYQKKVVFFAERDIYAGEEITYDYKFNYENDSKIPCFCNSINCRGYLN